MKLSQLFVKDAMQLDLQTTTKEATLNELATRFAAVGGVSDVTGYVNNLLKREEQSTTGVGEKIAMPHAQHESIQQAAIVFAKSQQGVEWESFDGQPANLIFMIAAPLGGGGEHLKALAGLSKVLMNEKAKDALLKVNSPEEVIAVIEQFEEGEEPTEQENVKEETLSPKEKPYILAVTACPTGIAHTYMAEEKLKQAAQRAGVDIKVETNGQTGIGNKLTREDIEKATAIIVAADKKVEMNRFNDKPTIITKVQDGIHKADELIERAVKQDAPLFKASEEMSLQDEEVGESLGRQFYKHLMNGVSHMLPFVVAGGILISISFFWGIQSSQIGHSEYNAVAELFNRIGALSFAMMLPIFSGFIGQSIADRPGLVIGFVGGVFANPASFNSFVTGGIFSENYVSSGFLGALVAGFLSGGIVWLLQKLFSGLPKSLEGLKPIFLYPVFGVLIMGVLMLLVVNGPMGAIMTGLQNFLSSMPRELGMLVGFVSGGMMAIDMGGPINKAAYVTGTALLTSANGSGSDIMAAVMVGGMVPPLAIALAATLKKDLFPKEERNGALINYVMGAAFITEGAIPFAAANPAKVIPSVALGAGIAGALSFAFNIVSYVPHGGLFAVFAGGVSNQIMFVMAWLIGSFIGAGLLILLLGKKHK